MDEIEVQQLIYEKTAQLERRLKRLEDLSMGEIRGMSSEIAYYKRKAASLERELKERSEC